MPFRDRRDRHRSKSRDSSSRGDKSVTIQTPGEPLLDAESTRGDDRVSQIFFYVKSVHFIDTLTIHPHLNFFFFCLNDSDCSTGVNFLVNSFCDSVE